MKWVAVFFFSFFLAYGQSQVTGLHSLRSINPYLDHSAYAGIDRSLEVHTGFRSQWNEIEGNPISQYISLATPLMAFPGAIGARVVNERFGALGNTQFSVSYSYQVPTRLGLWSVGARVSAIQLRIDGDRIRTPEGSYDDFFIMHNDGVLSAGNTSAGQLGLELSSFFSTGNLQIGLSIHNLNAPRLSIGANQVSIAQYQRSIHGLVRYQIRFMEDWVAVPSVVIHYTETSLQTAVIGQFMYRDGLSLGLGVRGYSSTTIESVVLSAGSRLGDRLWARYAFDLGLNRIARSGSGSHEIVLSYRLNLRDSQGVKRNIIYNPRFID